MHESIAKAQYRGGMRKADESTKNYFKRLARGPVTFPRTRTAWLKYIRRVLANEPTSVLLDARKWGSGKHQVGHIVRLALGETERRWFVESWLLRARDFDVDIALAPLDISHHLIERIMLRERIDNVMVAMRYLAPSIGVALAVLKHPDDEVLVPCGTGAIIAKRNTRTGHPSARVLATYIDAAKLSDWQRQQLEMMLKFGCDQLAQIQDGLISSPVPEGMLPAVARQLSGKSPDADSTS